MLLHPTSLPGPGYCGELGAEARRFVDVIAAAGLRIWQVLPLGPTHDDGCPYQSFSVHAGNPDLIDLFWLVEQGWLERDQLQASLADSAAKRLALDAACFTFQSERAGEPESPMARRYRKFQHAAADWLEDYVRFQAFREASGRVPWNKWPGGLREHEPEACEARAKVLASRLEALRFRQFVFDCQWQELRGYAHQRGVYLFGDMPIYVHLESADVWANQDLFDLDDSGVPITVTGVPPDYFSAEGQLWGNPQYDWDQMLNTGFEWWLRRFGSAARQFDIARIDHFRALEAFWEIPAEAESAQQGHWVKAPGAELLQAVRTQYPALCLVAENLGCITPEVESLRRQFKLPGMLILQFAFDGNPDNPYLAHRHAVEDIVYTGTHDNDTTLGWFNGLDAELRRRVYEYCGSPPDEMPWMLINQALESRANTAIVPWQDFLSLDGRHRMNTPGTTEGNWHWRFDWEQLPPELPARIRRLLTATSRL